MKTTQPRPPRAILTDCEVRWNRTGNHDKIYGAAEVIVFGGGSGIPNGFSRSNPDLKPRILAFNFYASRAQLRAKTMQALEWVEFTHPVPPPENSLHEAVTADLSTLNERWRTAEALVFDLLFLRKKAGLWWGEVRPETPDFVPYDEAIDVLSQKENYRGYSSECPEGDAIKQAIARWKQDYREDVVRCGLATIADTVRIIPDEVANCTASMMLAQGQQINPRVSSKHSASASAELFRRMQNRRRENREDEIQCKGSMAFGTGCGECRKCVLEMAEIESKKPARKFNKKRSLEL